MKRLALSLLLLASVASAQDAGVERGEATPPEPVTTGARGAEPSPPEGEEPAPPSAGEGEPPVADGETEADADPGSREPGAESREPGADAREPSAETDAASDADAASETDAASDADVASDADAASDADVASDADAASAEPVTRVERHTETRYIPVDTAEDDPISAEIEELANLFGTDRSTGALGLLLLVVLIAAFAAMGLRRVRDRLEPTGLLPTLLALVHLGLRLVAVAFALALLIRVAPPRASLVMLLTFGGIAVAIGWSARDVLPDLVAGFILVFERRVRRGMWLVGEGFSGQVHRVGVRSTLLVDVMGRQVEVPNRHLVTGPLTSDASGEQEHEVLVRFESDAPAEQIRAALRDAVYASPWVLPGSDAVVLRDPDEPWLWRVRGQLLDPILVARFEGDLLERAEEILAAFEATGRTPHDLTPPRSSRSEGDAL